MLLQPGPDLQASRVVVGGQLEVHDGDRTRLLTTRSGAGRPGSLHSRAMPGAGWNFADIWETVAEVIPDAPAQVQGTNRTTWRQFDERANGIAHALVEAGVQEQDKVAQYLYNAPEYLESALSLIGEFLSSVGAHAR